MTETKPIERVNMLEKQNRKLRQGAKLGVLALALLFLMGQTGCEKEQPKQAPTPAPIIEQPYQRFLPIAQGQGFLSFPYWAFDTKTGQLCKTWEWQDLSAASRKAQASGDTTKLTGIDAAAAGTPTCKQIWKESDEVSIESPAEWLKKHRTGKDPLGLFGPAEPLKSK